jgi:hypothetical protein
MLAVVAFALLLIGGFLVGLGLANVSPRLIGTHPLVLSLVLSLMGAGALAGLVTYRTKLERSKTRERWAHAKANVLARDLARGEAIDASALTQVDVPLWATDANFSVPSADALGRHALVALPRGTLLSPAPLTTASPELCSWLHSPQLPTDVYDDDDDDDETPAAPAAVTDGGASR